MTAALSGISPITRSKYVSRWRHWENFAKERNIEPWIVRTTPDWDDVMIDFILFETMVMGGAADVVKWGDFCDPILAFADRIPRFRDWRRSISPSAEEC